MIAFARPISVYRTLFFFFLISHSYCFHSMACSFDHTFNKCENCVRLENLLLKYADVYVNESCVKTHAYYLYCHYGCRVWEQERNEHWHHRRTMVKESERVREEEKSKTATNTHRMPIAFLTPLTKCLWLKLNTVVWIERWWRQRRWHQQQQRHPKQRHQQ